MHRRYTAARVAAAASDTDETVDNETERMLSMQNEQEEGHETEEVMSDIKEEISAVDVVDEAREPEKTKDDFNENNKDFEMFLVSPFDEHYKKTVPAYSERRHCGVLYD